MEEVGDGWRAFTFRFNTSKNLNNVTTVLILSSIWLFLLLQPSSGMNPFPRKRRWSCRVVVWEADCVGGGAGRPIRSWLSPSRLHRLMEMDSTLWVKPPHILLSSCFLLQCLPSLSSRIYRICPPACIPAGVCLLFLLSLSLSYSFSLPWRTCVVLSLWLSASSPVHRSSSRGSRCLLTAAAGRPVTDGAKRL